MMRALTRSSCLALAALLLSACAEPQTTDLRQWMDQQRSAMRPRVAPIEPPRNFEPAVYEGALLLSPMDASRVAEAIARLAERTSGGLQPDLDRRREPLESFPLDTITYVGSLEQRGERVALLRVGTALYQVRAGNYIGQNFGVILNITETRIELKELVQDAIGDWSERNQALELQERGQ